MTFTSLNEIELRGGTVEERRAAATLILAADSADAVRALLAATSSAG